MRRFTQKRPTHARAAALRAYTRSPGPAQDGRRRSCPARSAARVRPSDALLARGACASACRSTRRPALQPLRGLLGHSPRGCRGAAAARTRPACRAAAAPAPRACSRRWWIRCRRGRHRHRAPAGVAELLAHMRRRGRADAPKRLALGPTPATAGPARRAAGPAPRVRRAAQADRICPPGRGPAPGRRWGQDQRQRAGPEGIHRAACEVRHARRTRRHRRLGPSSMCTISGWSLGRPLAEDGGHRRVVGASRLGQTVSVGKATSSPRRNASAQRHRVGAGSIVQRTASSRMLGPGRAGPRPAGPARVAHIGAGERQVVHLAAGAVPACRTGAGGCRATPAPVPGGRRPGAGQTTGPQQVQQDRGLCWRGWPGAGRPSCAPAARTATGRRRRSVVTAVVRSRRHLVDHQRPSDHEELDAQHPT